MGSRTASPRRVVSAPSMSIDDDDDNDDDLPFDNDMPPRPADILPDDDDEDWMIRATGKGGRQAGTARRSRGRTSEAQCPHRAGGARLVHPSRGFPASLDASARRTEECRARLDAFGRSAGAECPHARRRARGFRRHGRDHQCPPGPVVTLYELEPAPGIKSSRVIGLADDIARSMSAISARVAVVPGRNAIGIELPNARRARRSICVSFASPRISRAARRSCALALGKTIGGEAVIADLARMPHLLVAGTTGSGKSVAINTMILSLLYRHDAGTVPADHDRPEDARTVRL